MLLRQLRTLRFALGLSLALAATALHAQTINVGPGQTYTTIQAGINAASDFETVLVAPGTYTENIDFTGKDIVVKSSAGAATTIISGLGSGPAVTMINVFGVGSLGMVPGLYGFTVQNGGKPSTPGGPQGAIYLYNSIVTIQNNILNQNFCGGIVSIDSTTNIFSNQIRNTLITGCSAAEGLGSGIAINGNFSNSGGAPLISNNLIELNTASVAYAADKGGGAAINVTNYPAPLELANNVLRNNTTTGYGGAVYIANTPTMKIFQNLVYGNKGISGGLDIVVPGSSVGPVAGSIVSNTIAGNTANTANEASDLYIAGNLAQYEIVNNVIIGYAPNQITVDCGTTYANQTITPLIFDHNDIYALPNTNSTPIGGACTLPPSQVGNISVDPQFVSGSAASIAAGTADLHLTAGSKAIDSGNNSAASNGTDLDGNPRILDGTGVGYRIVDMGAYEFTGTPEGTITTIALTPSTYTPTAGGSVTMTAVINTGAFSPTGTIAFLEDFTTVGVAPITASLNSGTATFTIPNLTAGLHHFTATYAQTGSIPPGVSVDLILLVAPATTIPTTLTLTVKPTTVIVGKNVTLTATLAPTTAQGHTATGSVIFYDGTTVIGTVPLPTNGVAVLDTTTLPEGTDQIGCVYSGDTNFATSSCNTVPVTVTGKPTTITLTSDNNPSYTYQNVTFTVKTTASGTGPLSPITLTANGTLLTTLTPTTDTTKYKTAFDTPGTYAIVATFAGNATQAPSSGTLSQVVILRPSTVGLVVTPAKVLVGQPVTLTATTVGLKPTEHPSGRLTFYDGTTSLGTFKLVKGVATLTTSTLAVGPHSLTCTYLGNKHYAGSNCNVVPYIVYAPATVALTATPSVVFVGNPVALGASVTSAYATPTGSITFLDGTNPLGTVSLASTATNTSSAGLTTTSLALGTHTITASYSGDSNFAPASSPPVTVTVEDLGFTMTPNPLTIHHGGTGVFTLNLNALGGPVIASPVTFTISGNPDHSPVTFSPATVPATAASAAATLTIATPDYPVGPWSSLHKPTYSREREITLAMLGLGGLLLPFARRSRRKLQRLTTMLLFVAVSILLGTASGCGSGWGKQSYNITVTATSGALSRSATATLITQP